MRVLIGVAAYVTAVACIWYGLPNQPATAFTAILMYLEFRLSGLGDGVEAMFERNARHRWHEQLTLRFGIGDLHNGATAHDHFWEEPSKRAAADIRQYDDDQRAYGEMSPLARRTPKWLATIVEVFFLMILSGVGVFFGLAYR